MLVFDFETADKPVSHVKPHVALRKTSATAGVSEISTDNSWNFCKVLGGNVSFPYLRTVTQLPVSKPERFMTLTFHSIYKMQD
jgi:hypothetical protein